MLILLSQQMEYLGIILMVDFNIMSSQSLKILIQKQDQAQGLVLSIFMAKISELIIL